MRISDWSSDVCSSDLLRVRRPRRIRLEDLGGVGEDAAVLTDDRAVGEIELAPPDDVGDVAEGADHGDAGALVGLGERVREHRDFDIEQGSAHRRAEQCLIALVFRVGDECDRSEEHTSELQSLMRISYPVFCLKKTTTLHYTEPN